MGVEPSYKVNVPEIKSPCTWVVYSLKVIPEPTKLVASKVNYSATWSADLNF